jgi:oligosaccharide repeat unit polymerase
LNFAKLKNIDIFNPYIIVVVVLLFLAIGIPSLYFSDLLKPPSNTVYWYIAIALIFFVLGIEFSKFLYKLFKKRKMSKKSINRYKNNYNSLKDKNSYKIFEYLIITLIIAGIILQIANFIILGGIPLFSGTLKAVTATKLWLFSYIFFLIGINIALAKYNRKIYYVLFIIGLGLFILTGYRTTSIVIVLSVFITLFYTKNFKLQYYLIFICLILFLLIAIGFIAVKAIEWQNWTIGPLELLSYRAGFTLNILDRAIQHQGSSNGTLFYYTLTGFFESVDPRVIVGEILNYKSHSITSTIFGPAILDFGGIAMCIQMFFLGFILKLLHILQNNYKSILTGFYGIILSQTLVWVETGPTDLVVWIFYIIAIFLVSYYFIKFDVEMIL